MPAGLVDVCIENLKGAGETAGTNRGIQQDLRLLN